MSATASEPMAALEAALERGDDGAVDRFWREIEQTGTPLVDEGVDGLARVTFLWRGRAGAVALQSPAGGIDPSKNRFARLAGTDVWYRSVALPAGTRMQYEIGVAATAEALERGWDALSWAPDPLNPRRHVFPHDDEGTFQGYPASVLELPGAPAQPWVDGRPEVAAGTLERRRVDGPGPGETRRVWLYSPAAATPTCLLVLFDGWTYAHVIPTATILDNLIAAGRIPSTAALLVDNPDRRRELAFDERFVDFVADDLVPPARGALDAPSDARRTIVGGASLGGVAGVFAALRRPDVFGNVLSQSGAFWCKRPGDDADESLRREVERLPRRPLRFYLDVGTLEGRQSDDAPTQVEANRRLREALASKGYPVDYAEFAGGHDHLCWRGSLADGLIALVGGSPA